MEQLKTLRKSTLEMSSLITESTHATFTPRIEGNICNEIIVILNSLCLGPHHYKVAIMLRQAMLLSVLLFSAETYHRLSKDNIKKLENIMILRKILHYTRGVRTVR